MSRRLIIAVLAATVAGDAYAQIGLRLPADLSAPKPAAKAKQKPAVVDENERVKAAQRIFECVAAGLPGDWRRAWAEVTEIATDGNERRFEGRFYYLPEAEGAEPVDLAPCDTREVAERIYALNDYLEPEQRRWQAATLIFTRDGKFELKYDYRK